MLTAKQQRFVEEYCANGFNATQAAISAGYSEKTSGSISSENLQKPEIQKAIKEFMGKATEKALVTTEDIVKGLYDIAQYGESESARVSAYKTLTDYTGGFDKNKQSVDHSSSDGSFTGSLNVTISRPKGD
ncbi:terminase small subunit [Vibrio phage pYD21-A]|uniref:terminase small subunit n=1 Tax=Vibrio phage pYD21-A TaxID=754049 RepID=UPI0002C0F68C|nr:terminase small subunit [Vibrio phage pYD21-A]AGH16104.1 hypothetical protein VPKG_00067 [Vibrio phage pYD21-A]